MTPKLMALAAAVVLTVVFLSPIAFLAGQRASAWLAEEMALRTGPVPSQEEVERGPGPADRFKPAVRPGFGDI